MVLLTLASFGVGICIGSFFHERVQPIYTSTFTKVHDVWQNKVLVHKK